jgi:hypothetical protein
MDIADEIVVSEGLAPSSERDLLEKIAAALDAERAAVVAWLNAEANAPHPIEAGERALSPSGRGLLLRAADAIERGEHRREGEG